MTTALPLDHPMTRRRELQVLSETAAAAVGGGTVLALVRDQSADGVFHAEVAADDGTRLTVRLDAVLATVQVSPAARVAVAA